MRTRLRTFFGIALLLLSSLNVFAGPPPPPGGADPVPINQEIYTLIIVAVLYGLYRVYRYKLNQKTSA